jgi:hypothetical protein
MGSEAGKIRQPISYPLEQLDLVDPLCDPVGHPVTEKVQYLWSPAVDGSS